jgi:hypothetical protein
VFEVVLQPGLLTVAEKVKCSPVPIVAAAGEIEILIPVMIVSVALSIFVVSAWDVPVIVTVGAITVVPLDVVVGTVAGAVYSPLESIVPQVFAVTPVAQARVHVTVVLLEPDTEEENCSVVLVTTLEVVGEIVSVTVVAALPPHPYVPSAIARVSIE